MVSVLNNDGTYTCSCNSQSFLYYTACFYSPEFCGPFCADGCLSLTNPETKCMSCDSSTMITTPNADGTVTCSCPPGTSNVNGYCAYPPAQCGNFCSEGCTSLSQSYTRCIDCASHTMLGLEASDGLYTCICPNGTNYVNNGPTYTTGRCIYPPAMCGAYCKGGCLDALNPQSTCIDCAFDFLSRSRNVDSTYSCLCNAGMALINNTCAYTPDACDSTCVYGCMERLNPNSCTDCPATVSKQVTGTAGPQGTTTYNCGCALPRTMANGTCVYTTNCDSACMGGLCTVQNTPTKCLDCAPGINIIRIGYKPPYHCRCAPGTIIFNGKCTYNTHCHNACNGLCFNPDDNSTCVDCVNSILTKEINPKGGFKCSCAQDGVLMMNPSIGYVCGYKTGCSSLCRGGCFVKDSPADCVECSDETIRIEKTLLGFLCIGCPVGSKLINGECVYIGNQYCHGLCNGKCLAIGDPTQCLSCKRIANIQTVGKYSPVECRCVQGALYDSNLGRCYFDQGCDKQCNGTCLTKGDNTKCLTCRDLALYRGTVDGYTVTCGCPSGMTYYQGRCIYSTKCHDYCAGLCTKQNSENSCLECNANYTTLIKTDNKDGSYKCACVSGKTLYQGQCLYKDNCHKYCNYCTVLADKNSCFECKYKFSVFSDIRNLTSGLHSCKCLKTEKVCDVYTKTTQTAGAEMLFSAGGVAFWALLVALYVAVFAL